jgi:ubiquinone/menaquinone biosynthesis methyltransferase
MSLGIDVRWRANAVARMMPDDGPDAPRVLDLCAGTMDSSVEIHTQFPTADILAGDFAAQMLERGASKLHGARADRITPRQLDAHALPLDDDALDAIYCAFGVRNLSDLPRATAEQARCLRPGGVLTILEFFRPTAMLPRVMHAVYNRTLLPVIGWAATGDWDAYTYLPRSIGQFETVEAYTELLTAHGFSSIEVDALTFGMAWVVRAVRGPQEAAR